MLGRPWHFHSLHRSPETDYNPRSVMRGDYGEFRGKDSRMCTMPPLRNATSPLTLANPWLITTQGMYEIVLRTLKPCINSTQKLCIYGRRNAPPDKVPILTPWWELLAPSVAEVEFSGWPHQPSESLQNQQEQAIHNSEQLSKNINYYVIKLTSEGFKGSVEISLEFTI